MAECRKLGILGVIVGCGLWLCACLQRVNAVTSEAECVERVWGSGLSTRPPGGCDMGGRGEGRGMWLGLL